MIFHLSKGFTADYSLLCGEGRGVTERDIEENREKIRLAGKALDRIRTSGAAVSSGIKEECVWFPRLPYIWKDTELLPQSERRVLEELAASCPDETDALISVGIGGSYLGSKVLFDVFCGEFWNLMTREERNGRPQVFFAGKSADPDHLSCLIGLLKREAAEKKGTFRVLVLVTSKSGTTIEPMSALAVLREQMQGENLEVRYAAITDLHKGKLRELAGKEHWPCFSVPEGVGGRFSIFSQVGLVFGALIGIDIRQFLAGAQFMEESCRSGDVRENPALAAGVLKYIASEKYGAEIEVTMPYRDRLFSVSQWYSQLLGESLGKKYSRTGGVIHYGRTPVSSVGTTDMHSLTQEHQEGRKNKILQFITVAEQDSDITIPGSGTSLGQVTAAAQKANADALAQDGRMSCVISISRTDAFHIGALLYFFCLSVAYEGEMANVNAYDQPGVEIYKKFLKEYISAQTGKKK